MQIRYNLQSVEEISKERKQVIDKDLIELEKMPILPTRKYFKNAWEEFDDFPVSCRKINIEANFEGSYRDLTRYHIIDFWIHPTDNQNYSVNHRYYIRQGDKLEEVEKF